MTGVWEALKIKGAGASDLFGPQPRSWQNWDFRPRARYRLSVICQSDLQMRRARQDSNLRPPRLTDARKPFRINDVAFPLAFLISRSNSATK
jgi:hypothetical protein